MTQLDTPKIEVRYIPIEQQAVEGKGSEVMKWKRVESYLRKQVRALGSIDKQTRLSLPREYSIINNQNTIVEADRIFLEYITEKMKDVLYGKGKSKTTGYQDEAGIAHSELICWDTLGIINFPNYSFSRSDLEKAYIETFIDLDDRGNIDLSNLTNDNLVDILLARKEGSETLAYYHSKSSINWKRLHNLPYLSNKHHEAKTILSKKKEQHEK